MSSANYKSAGDSTSGGGSKVKLQRKLLDIKMSKCYT